MGKGLVALGALSLILGANGIFLPHNLQFVGHGVNGGTDCAACTLFVNLFSQYHVKHNLAPEKAMREVCSFWPPVAKQGCDALVDLEGGAIAKLIAKGEDPDTVCQSLKDAPCFKQTEMCRLFPTKRTEAEQEAHVKALRESLGHPTGPNKRLLKDPMAEIEYMNTPGVRLNPNGWLCKHFKAVCKIINDFGDEHLPVEDFDQDGYSTIPTLRGSDWRGKDCNDVAKHIHPGANPEGKDDLEDKNCNGIFGFAPSGKTYEKEFCEGTDPMGTLILGDSASAHFHLPPNWFNITEVNPHSFKYMDFAIENELDWPMLSMYTGSRNTTKWVPTINGNMSSLYQGMFEINHCNHRDYQNLGVNGASSRNINTFAQYFNRNNQTDYPLLITMALVGNDVCDSSTKISRMTPPQEYYEKIKKLILQLDVRVPKGSKMVTIGLVDGRVLWDNMHNRIHPVGALKKDVTYKDIYHYLNCLTISPCAGWMNEDAAVRNATSAHAALLTQTLAKVVEDVKDELHNIELYNIGNVLTKYINKAKKMGYEIWELIEPMDGFHPNQKGNALMGTELLQQYMNMSLLPPVNPHNAAIRAKFGDQGGY